jgi:hypothetical protein
MYNVDIVVTDQVFYCLSVRSWASPYIDPKSQQKKPEDNQWAANSRGWTDVLEMDAVEAVRHFNASGRTLLMIWPGYADPMAYNAVESYQVYPLLALWAVTWTDSGKQGEYIIFVGEGECGCTADDAFFELMEVGCIQYLAEVWANYECAGGVAFGRDS